MRACVGRVLLCCGVNSVEGDKEAEDSMPWDGTDRDYSYTEV